MIYIKSLLLSYNSFILIRAHGWPATVVLLVHRRLLPSSLTTHSARLLRARLVLNDRAIRGWWRSFDGGRCITFATAYLLHVQITITTCNWVMMQFTTTCARVVVVRTLLISAVAVDRCSIDWMMCDEQFKQPAAVLVNILAIPPTGSGVKWLGQRSLIRTYVCGVLW